MGWGKTHGAMEHNGWLASDGEGRREDNTGERVPLERHGVGTARAPRVRNNNKGNVVERQGQKPIGLRVGCAVG